MQFVSEHRKHKWHNKRMKKNTKGTNSHFVLIIYHVATKRRTNASVEDVIGRRTPSNGSAFVKQGLNLNKRVPKKYADFIFSIELAINSNFFLKTHEKGVIVVSSCIEEVKYKRQIKFNSGNRADSSNLSR
jgi:hypothetical protein